MGVLEATGSDVPNLIKDVPNFVKDVPRVRKCVLRWGSTPKHFLIGSKMKLWTIYIHMGILEVIGSDLPNLMKDVSNFVKDVPRVPTCIQMRNNPQALPYRFSNEIMDFKMYQIL